MATIEDIRGWYDETLGRYASWKHCVDLDREPSMEGRLRFWLYTDNNRYAITARDPSPCLFPVAGAEVRVVKLTVTEIEAKMAAGMEYLNLRSDGFVEITAAETRLDGGYLGCVATSRKPRAGERHCRGNDLPDGPLNRETWNSIVGAVVGYELVKVHHSKSDPALAEAWKEIAATGDLWPQPPLIHPDPEGKS